jgi:hypothetical protein
MFRMLMFLARLRSDAEKNEGDEFATRTRSNTLAEVAGGILFWGAGIGLVYWMLFRWL